MWYLLNAYWIPLLLAGMLGVIIGWMSCNNEPNRGLSQSGWFSGWMPWAVAGAALAALAAVQMPAAAAVERQRAIRLRGAAPRARGCRECAPRHRRSSCGST